MDELLIKYVLEEATDEERRQVEAWVAESPENLRRLEEFHRVWAFGQRTAAPVRTDEVAALTRLKQRMAPSAPVRKMRIGRVAAVIAGLLAVGAGTWTALHQKKAPTVVTATPTQSSAETTIVIRNTPLPTAPAEAQTKTDGPVIALEKNAKIEWLPQGSNHHRRVRLTGNAQFKVDADPAHPFIVETKLLRVKVLGTVFRVIDAADSALVAVDTGRVLAATAGDSVILREGEMAIAYRGSQQLKLKVNREKLDAKQVMRRLIDQVIREGLVADRESLGWLALDDHRFIIDGVSPPDSIRTRYQSKYLLKDGMGFYYGNVKVHGHGYFYEKKELF
ncbi:MAG TPA: FecR domain-containing protein [Puia sp.]|uniref:FecR domain-containing protein n=1 Tax=Puia sp. TaxID=2045100 RepID=UPI002BCA622C|nr:FecR domain-containing protein [Puia sp.]HVU96425.1 FecR domain-containing protein [Puia sp.]